MVLECLYTDCTLRSLWYQITVCTYGWYCTSTTLNKKMQGVNVYVFPEGREGYDQSSSV